MSYDTLYAIAAAGMSLEKLRVEVAANNIANQYSLQSPEGSPFEPMQVLATAMPFDSYLNNIESNNLATIRLAPQHLPPNKVYQPEHPFADKQGFVNYPGLSMVDEMTTMLRASRAYEANVKVFNTAHGLFLQALNIGDER